MTEDPFRPDSDDHVRHDDTVLEHWRALVEQYVVDALDELAALLAPDPQLSVALENVTVAIVDDAPEDEPDTLGMYFGQSEDLWAAPTLPPRIEIYVLPLLDHCTPDYLEYLEPDLELLAAETRITVRHEVGHHLGMGHDRLDAIGLQ